MKAKITTTVMAAVGITTAAILYAPGDSTVPTQGEVNLIRQLIRDLETSAKSVKDRTDVPDVEAYARGIERVALAAKTLGVELDRLIDVESEYHGIEVITLGGYVIASGVDVVLTEPPAIETIDGTVLASGNIPWYPATYEEPRMLIHISSYDRPVLVFRVEQRTHLTLYSLPDDLDNPKRQVVELWVDEL